jgi:hypothetical protein
MSDLILNVALESLYIHKEDAEIGGKNYKGKQLKW